MVLGVAGVALLRSSEDLYQSGQAAPFGHVRDRTQLLLRATLALPSLPGYGATSRKFSDTISRSTPRSPSGGGRYQNPLRERDTLELGARVAYYLYKEAPMGHLRYP